MTKGKSKASPVRVEGPLEPLAKGFKDELIKLGYTPLSAANQLRVMAHLSRWMEDHEIAPDELTAERVDGFLADRRAAGYTCWRSLRGLGPLLGYLRRTGVVPERPATAPVGPLEQLVKDYGGYLLVERGLSASTAANCTTVARGFFAWWEGRNGALDLASLTARDVQEFVIAECGQRCVGFGKARGERPSIGARVLAPVEEDPSWFGARGSRCGWMASERRPSRPRPP